MWILNRFTSQMALVQILFEVSRASTTQAAKDFIQCGNLQCSNNAKCRDDGHGGQQCQCLMGFTGLTCLDDTDECGRGNPCMHRGHCHNSIGSYRCECLEGWSGPEHCEIKDNSTTVHKCMPGWIGDLCQDQCLNNSMCRPTEVCKKRGRGLRCLCAAGWHGDNCTIDDDECTRTPCPITATCMNTPGSFECPCLSGWKGDNCDEDINECLINPCLHSSTCTNEKGYYNCTCALGWKGDNCTNDIDECTSNPCPNKSNCFNTLGSFDCKCSPGWEGVNCVDDIDECKTFPCRNSGTCINTIGSYDCKCTFGWKGGNCGEDIDECDQKPCNVTAICINSQGSFTCTSAQITSKGRSDQTRIIIPAVLGSLLMLCSIVIFLGIIKFKWSSSREATKVSPNDTEHVGTQGKKASQKSGQPRQNNKSEIKSESQTFGGKTSVPAKNRFIQPEWIS